MKIGEKALLQDFLILISLAGLTAIRATESNESNNTNADNLLVLLTRNYNKAILPQNCLIWTGNYSLPCSPFKIKMRMFLIRVQDILESKQTLYTTVRMQIAWEDYRLKWNADDHGGLSAIVVPYGMIWQPDLQLTNSATGMYDLVKQGNFNFRLFSNGQIWWHPTATISTRCDMIMEYYPFDYQICPIVYESSLYTVKELELELRYPQISKAISLSMFSENLQWKLVNYTGYPMIYPTSSSTAFSRIHFWLVLEREPTWVETTFLVPIALLSIVALMTYILPTHYIDRTAQSTVVLLSVAVYQGSVTQMLPKTSKQSRVVYYINIVMGLCVAAVAVSAVTIAMVRPDKGFPAPFGLPRVVKLIRGKHSMSKSEKKKKLSKNALVAVLVNWAAFIATLGITLIYPCLTFMTIRDLPPPPPPSQPSDLISTEYYPVARANQN